MIANKSYLKMHVRHRAMKTAKAVASGKSVTESDGNAQLAVWQQGDAELSTQENLVKRELLRRDPRVVKALDVFFVGIAKAQLRARLAAEGPFEKISADGETFIMITEETDLDALLGILDTNISVDWKGYHALYTRIYKVMLSSDDNEDAEESIAEDWEEDRNGRTYLSREGLERSLFEMVDLWCETIDGDAYAGFLQGLLSKITDPNSGGWLPLHELYCEDEGPLPAPPPPAPAKINTRSNQKKSAAQHVVRTAHRRPPTPPSRSPPVRTPVHRPASAPAKITTHKSRFLEQGGPIGPRVPATPGKLQPWALRTPPPRQLEPPLWARRRAQLGSGDMPAEPVLHTALLNPPQLCSSNRPPRPWNSPTHPPSSTRPSKTPGAPPIATQGRYATSPTMPRAATLKAKGGTIPLHPVTTPSWAIFCASHQQRLVLAALASPPSAGRRGLLRRTRSASELRDAGGRQYGRLHFLSHQNLLVSPNAFPVRA